MKRNEVLVRGVALDALAALCAYVAHHGNVSKEAGFLAAALLGTLELTDEAKARLAADAVPRPGNPATKWTAEVRREWLAIAEASKRSREVKP